MHLRAQVFQVVSFQQAPDEDSDFVDPLHNLVQKFDVVEERGSRVKADDQVE